MTVVPGIELLGQAQKTEQIVVHLADQITQAMPAEPRHRSRVTYAQQMAGLVVEVAQQQLMLHVAEKAHGIGLVQKAAFQHAELLLVKNDYPVLVLDARCAGGGDKTSVQHTHTAQAPATWYPSSARLSSASASTSAFATTERSADSR